MDPTQVPRATWPRATKRAVARRLPPIRRLLDERGRLSGEVLELRRQIDRLHGDIDRLHEHLAALLRRCGLYPPGHFYSPLPDFQEILAHDREVFERTPRLTGIDLRDDAQLALVGELRQYAGDQPFGADPTPGLRYHFQNDYFGWGDGLILFCMLRHLRPAQVIEVGSGFSSALMLDTSERFLDGKTELTFIEPFPERLHALLREGDDSRVTLLSQPVQEVDPAVFDRLEPGDVLFVDSSHVSKIGSDVNLLLLEVVPSLPAGVHLHVHDIIWPFEYSRQWLQEGRAWNEAYLLRALLVDNARLRMTFWSSYLRARHEDFMAAALPLWLRDSGTSLWLETG
ncbi:MAG TPA: class I SAM-dependent methyltransferase [Actinomycetes bacterium]|nr:class I SAM-dependent methyltransferase [Actinomycetes bacterium]